MLLSAILLVVLHCVLPVAAAGNSARDYDSTCNCSAISSNGNVCLQYTCLTEQRTSACFAGRSLIVTGEGLQKPLSDIRIGERVLVDVKDNQLVFEPVYGFVHMKRDGFFDFLSINVEFDDRTDETTSLFVSPNHLIFWANDQGSLTAVFASQLHVGDRVHALSHNQLRPSTIRSIHLVREQGFYAPLTPSGTIVVDNVLASNYATVSNHDLAHRFMQVYRWWTQLSPWHENDEHVPQLLTKVLSFVQWYGIERLAGTKMYDETFQVSALV